MAKAIITLVIISILFFSSSALAYYNRIETENYLQGTCSSTRPSITGGQSIANALCSSRDGIKELKNEIDQIKAENQKLQEEIDYLKNEFNILRKIVIAFQRQIIEIQKIMISFARSLFELL